MKLLGFSRGKVQNGPVKWGNTLVSNLENVHRGFMSSYSRYWSRQFQKATNTNNLIHFNVFWMCSFSVSENNVYRYPNSWQLEEKKKKYNEKSWTDRCIKKRKCQLILKKERECKLNMTNKGNQKPQQLIDILCQVINHAHVRLPDSVITPTLLSPSVRVARGKHWEKTRV